MAETAHPVRLGARRRRRARPLRPRARPSPGVTVSEVQRRGPGDRHGPQGPARGAGRRGAVRLRRRAARSRRGACEGRDIAFIWSGPDQWLACTQPAPAGGMEALLAAAVRRARLDRRPEPRAHAAARDRAPRPRRAGQGRADRSPPARLQAGRCGRHARRPHRRPALADRRRADLRVRRARAAWRRASGTGSRHRPPNTGWSSWIGDCCHWASSAAALAIGCPDCPTRA